MEGWGWEGLQLTQNVKGRLYFLYFSVQRAFGKGMGPIPGTIIHPSSYFISNSVSDTFTLNDRNVML